MPYPCGMNAKSISAGQTTTFAADRPLLGLYSAIAGGVLIFLVGFAPLSAVHNAAHDTRHTAAFPCH
jgi:cobalt transporter subunit CbtB